MDFAIILKIGKKTNKKRDYRLYNKSRIIMLRPQWVSG